MYRFLSLSPGYNLQILPETRRSFPDVPHVRSTLLGSSKAGELRSCRGPRHLWFHSVFNVPFFERFPWVKPANPSRNSPQFSRRSTPHRTVLGEPRSARLDGGNAFARDDRRL